MNTHVVSANNPFFIKDKVAYMFHLQNLCASKRPASKGQCLPWVCEGLDTE